MEPEQSIRSRPAESPLVTAVIVGVALLLPAVRCLLSPPVDDPDVWWHLRAGQWIVEHRALPRVDTFSSHGQGAPWAAYSWAPEIVLYGLYELAGLRGLLVYTAGLSVAIVAAFFHLLWRLRLPGSLDVIFVLAATLGLLPVLTPRPWLLSVLFLIVELDLLLTSGRTGNRWLLLWLIPVFVAWANAHIQFVLGLVVLGAAVAEPLAARFLPASLVDPESRRIPFWWMLLVFLLSAGATLVNPYHVQLYPVAAELMGQSQLWSLIQELLAMNFRSPSNWLVLAAAIAAAFALGWRRRARLLLVLLFCMALYFGFKSQRDTWFLLVVSFALLAYCLPRGKGRQGHVLVLTPLGGEKENIPVPFSRWVLPATVAIVLLAACLLTSESRLRRKVAEHYPAQAAQFIAENHYPGPMFNPYDWGGYLILYLPQLPVSMDGRTMVHGQQRVVRHCRTLRGEEGWHDDPELVAARLVVLPRDKALSSLLRLDPRFRLEYEDSLAAVFSKAPLAEEASRLSENLERTPPARRTTGTAALHRAETAVLRELRPSQPESQQERPHESS